MAVIPRNYGDGRLTSTPAINTVKMDPNVAAAPYRAAEQSSEQLQQVFGKELNEWGKIFQQEEQARKAAEAKQAKVTEGLYKAEAMANIQVQSNDLYNKMKQSSDGTQSFAPAFDQEFQKMAQQVIANAPSPEAKVDLTKRLIGTRSQLYTKATNESLHQNNQINMNRIENMLGQYESLAASNPGAIDEIKKQSADVLSSMGQLGIPEIARKKIMEKFDRNLEYTGARSNIDANPLAMSERLSSGEFAHLGPKASQALTKYAEATTKARASQYEDQLKDATARLVSGMPISNDLSNVFAEAPKYGLGSHVDTVDRLMKLSSEVGQASPQDLLQSAQTIKVEAASGLLKSDPKELKLLTDFLEGNAEALTKDPLSYAQMKGSMAPLPPISDFSKLSDQEIEDRKFRALQVQNGFGVKAPAITATDAKTAANMLVNSDIETQMQVVANMNKLGQNSIKMVDAALPSGSPLSTVLRLSSENPEVTREVLMGLGKIKAGFKPDPTFVSTATASDKFKDLFMDDPSHLKALVDAGVALAANSGNQSSELLEDNMIKAGNLVNASTGFFSRNYYTVAPGPGMSSSDFSNFLSKNLKDPEAWVKYGTGVPASGGTREPIKFKSTDPQDFKYKYESDGMYRVFNGNDPVINSAGQPVRIDLKALYSSTNKR